MKFSIQDMAKALASDIRNNTTNKLIRRSGTFEPGTYDVTIAAVNTNALDNGRLTVTFESAHREQHNQTIFLANYDGDGFSESFETLLFGLFGSDKETIYKYLVFLSDPANANHAFNMMRGMKLRIVLKESEGFKIVSRGGNYYAIWNTSDEVVAGPFPRMNQAKQAALANGHKEPRTYLNDTEPTHALENCTTLHSATKAVADATTSRTNNQVRPETTK